MEMHPQNDIDGRPRDNRSVLRWMTSEQLLDLGMNQVVYLKSGMCDGRMLFVLFGADDPELEAWGARRPALYRDGGYRAAFEPPGQDDLIRRGHRHDLTGLDDGGLLVDRGHDPGHLAELPDRTGQGGQDVTG